MTSCKFIFPWINVENFTGMSIDCRESISTISLYVFNYAVIYWIDKIRNMHSKISSPRASILYM